MIGLLDCDTIDHCLLCGSGRSAFHSVAEPNLYSEKLSTILGTDEGRLLDAYPNHQCLVCGLVFKRRWFPAAAIAELFSTAVPEHPRGWDAVGSRFSAEGLECAVEQWVTGHRRSATSSIRRAQRELLSILDSITAPVGYDPDRAVAAISHGDVAAFLRISGAVRESITEPAPFKRFTGFRSVALWDYLQRKVDGVQTYAELGCPLWGLLPLAAERGVRATFIAREEPNYWGPGCVNDAQHCAARLLQDPNIGTAPWHGPERFSLIGVFQYLDHVRRPVEFLEKLLAKTESVAFILDGGNSPLAIQHVTGWSEQSLGYAARVFGRRLHADFEEIRPSGNVLYLLTEGR